jgi:4-hydroxy-4-methyl-2-oxoglutarate aldolase
VSVRGTIKASSPSVGQQMLFGGVPVAAGDMVVADDDGVIIVPAAELERTLAAAETRASKEAEMMARLSQGETTMDLLGLSAWRVRA